MLPPKLLEAQENRLSVCFNLLGVFVSICWCVWISSLALYGEAYYQGSLNFGNFVQFGQNYSLIFKRFVLWSYNNSNDLVDCR